MNALLQKAKALQAEETVAKPKKKATVLDFPKLPESATNATRPDVPEYDPPAKVENLDGLQRRYALAHEGYVIDLKTGTLTKFTNFELRFAHLDPVQVKDNFITATAAWKKSKSTIRLDAITCAPGKPRFFLDDGNLIFNTWAGWPIASVKGDIKPFLQLVARVVGDDAEMFLQWAALPFQKPGERCNFILILFSTVHGVGKDLLLGALESLHGAGGRTVPPKLLRSDFTGWQRGRTFVNLAEVRFERGVADAITALLTATKNSINEKNVAEYEEENCINYAATTNHSDAAPIKKYSRREWVIRCDKGRLPPEEADAFVLWRDNGGLAALMYHLLHEVDLTGFNHRGNAPDTAAKLEMRYSSMSDMERWLDDFITATKFKADGVTEEPANKDVWYIGELRSSFENFGSYKTTDSAILHALADLGMTAKKRVRLKSGKQVTLHAIRNNDQWLAAENQAWAAEYAK